jgi:hypothetical protein
MRNANLWRVLSSPWWVLAFFVFAWAPVFIAEFVRVLSPSLDASYAPQSFAIHWLPIALLCSAMALALLVGHAVIQVTQASESWRIVMSGGVLLSVFLLLGTWIWSALPHGRTVEIWLLPEGYVGWVRLDYSIPGAPALPKEKGRYVVRINQSGRLQTSTANRPPLDDNEYMSVGPHGTRRLADTIDPNNLEYAVRSVSSFGEHGKPPVAECAFVGTDSDFESHKQLLCQDWEIGKPEPPDRNQKRKTESK